MLPPPDRLMDAKLSCARRVDLPPPYALAEFRPALHSAPLVPCRLIEVIVLAFLTPAGRKAASKVLRDAAASMHRLMRRRSLL